MSAFGPYGGVEEINFEKFYETNLFLISGDTGSGKTTIFDAICFALYGSVCDHKKEVKTLKSNFSNENQLCFVELEFESRGKRYIIKRIPEQTVAKLSGDGLKQQKHSAELLMPDGNLKTNLKEILNLIENQLVGFDRISFNKIVMLPQGQFFKLLTERGEQQLKTFRTVFETEIYEQIADGLFNFKQKILKNFEACEQHNLKIINLILSSDFDFLKMKLEPIKNFDKIISWLKENNRLNALKVSNLEIVLQKIEDSLQKLHAQLELCDVLKNKKLKLKELNLTLLNLQKHCPSDLEISKNENLVRKLESLKILKQSLDELCSEFEEKNVQVSKIEKNLNECKIKLVQALENFKKNEILNERVNCLQNEIERVSVFENSVKVALGLKNELEIMTQKLKNNEHDLKLAQDKKIGFFYQTEIESEQILISKLNELFDYCNRKNNLQLKLSKLKHVYDDSFKLYFQNQAALLAEKLLEGEPCPVCGSKRHPKKIKRVNQCNVDYFKLEEIKKQIESYSIQLSEISSEIGNLMLVLQVKHSLSLEFTDDLSELEELKNLIKLHNLKLQNLNNDMLKKVPAYCLNLKLTSEVDYDLEIEKLKLNLKKNKDNYLMFENKIKCILQNIPKKLQNVKSLDAFKKSKVNEKKLLLNKIELFINQKNAQEKNVTGLKIKLDAVKNNLNEISQKKIKAQQQLNLNLKLCSLDFKEFVNSLKNLENIKNSLNESKNILRRIEKLKIEKQTLEFDLNRLENLDYEKLNALKLKKIKRKGFFKKLQISLVNTLAVNENCFKVLESSNLELKRLNKKYGAAKMLSEVAKGTRKRLGFERYVICSFINEVLIFASSYLKKTTNERYVFEKLNFKSMEGLNFSVIDFYSGKIRDVSTLSGGETFVAALSLCLGLRDVISSKFFGGTMLSTMLIDEGFGTLDSKFLSSVLVCLQNLSGTNNLVGIISHVEELKHRINFQIQVKSRVNGGGSEIKIKF